MASPEIDNPFAGILTTDALAARRDAARANRFKGEDFWVREAGNQGASMADTLRAGNVGLTMDDISARNNERILSTTEKRYADYIAEGKMAPDEAQAAVLEETIRSFASAGNYRGAQQLIPVLAGVRKQQIERGKLLQETHTSASTENKNIADVYKTQSEIAKNEAELPQIQQKIKTDAAMEDLHKAQAEYERRRYGGGPRDKAEGELSAGEKKERIAMEHAAEEGASGIAIFKNVRDLIIANPGAATDLGPLATKLSGYAANFKATISSRYPLDPKAAYTTVEGEDPLALIKNNRGISSAVLQSLTVDLAYALARSRDPGGRLSNQDVQQAAKIVGGEGSPETRLAVLDSAFQRFKGPTARTLSRGLKQYQLDPDTVDMFTRAVQDYETPTPKKTATPVPTPVSGNPPRGTETAAQRAARLGL